MLDYFYDGQIRRYMTQFIRIFLNLHYSTGVDAQGNPILRKIPAKYALRDAMVGAILGNNSENTAVSFPQITCDLENIQTNSNRIQSPNFIGQVDIVEREYDPVDNKYLRTRGKSYSAKRFMPVPLDMTMKVDIWTTNESQKHQIMEQLLMLFNPSIDIQTSENAVDWSSLTIVELKDIQWSTRSIPIGDTSNSIDSATLTFNVPIWINPPAKVIRSNIIEQIITNINQYDQTLVSENMDPDTAGLYWSESDRMSRVITTPGNHVISVNNNEITLLGAHGTTKTEGGLPYDWKALLEEYGTFRDGISQLRIKTTDSIEDYETDVVGTFSLDPNNPNKVIWNIDPMSLPTNTTPNVNGIINPSETYIGNGLPIPKNGDRYLILGKIRESNIWGTFSAEANDIIMFNGTEWVKALDASVEKNNQYVVNKQTGQQLKLVNGVWEYSINKKYSPGYWRIFL